MSQNIQIHSGDKFVVYAEGLSSISSLISNYNNTSDSIIDYSKPFYSTRYENRIFSPQNKRYTLQLGILNSQNEFVDITKTLERWEKVGDNWKIITTSEESEELKFNHGYFIPDSFSEKLQGETGDDAKLLLERQKLPTNTYSYKLVGPLYLKVIYNHIQNFSYNISASISPDAEDSSKKILELVINGNITYNCPDGSQVDEIPTTPEYEKYWTYGERSPSNNAFQLIKYENFCVAATASVSKYNPITNLYSAEITKEYKIKLDSNSKIFSYTIGVLADLDNHNSEDPVYLKECSVSGQLNLYLIESSAVFVREWRFWNDVANRQSKLLYNFNSYPKKGEYFDNLQFHFKEIVKEGDTSEFVYPRDFGIEGTLPVPNGRNIVTIDWRSHFKERAAYKVTISYDKVTTEKIETVQLKEQNYYYSSDPIERWFLSTELLNSLFPLSSGILDFCNPRFYDEKMQDLFKIPYKLNIEKTITIEKEGSKKEGSFFAFNNQYANYSVRKDTEYKIDLIPKIELQNMELYPEFISLPQNYSLSLKNVSKIKIGEEGTINESVNTALRKVSGNYNKIDGFNQSEETKFKDKPLINILSGETDQSILLWTTCMHYYCGQAQTINQLENPFIDFKKGLARHLPKPGYYGGVYPFNYVLSSSTFHEIDYYYNKQSYFADTPSEIGNAKGTDRGETKNYNYTGTNDAIGEGINELFNNHSFEFQTIQFIFPQGGTTHQCLQDGTSYNNDYARVWWKCQNRYREYWYPLSKLLSKSDWEDYLQGKKDLKFFLDILGISENYVYSPEKFITNPPIGVAKPENSIYTNNYSFPISLDVEFRPKDKININTLDYGNLKFYLDFYSIKQTVENIITVESDSNFQEDIDNYDPNTFSNIYYSEDKNIILDSDSNGKPLDPNVQYTLDTDSRGNYKLYRSTRRKPLALKEQENENIRIPLGNVGMIPEASGTGDYDSYSSQNEITKLIY